MAQFRLLKIKNKSLLLFLFTSLLLLSSIVVNIKPVFAAETYSMSKIMSGGDILEWNLSNTGNTDIILFPSKIGLNSSTQFLAVGDDSSKIQYKAQTGNYTLKGDGNQSNCGSIGFIQSFSSTYDIKASFTVRYANAARGISGQYYDLYMTFSNMKVHPGGDTKSHGAAIIYGCSGYLEYNAFKYDSDDGVMGLKTDVTVRLYKSGSSMAKVTNADGTKSVQITGTQIENGHKLAWGVADVDIRDKINDNNGASAPNYHYDSSHQWAEHVRFYNVNRAYNANLNDNYFYGPVYVSSDSELAKSEQGDHNQNMTLYHNFDTDDPYNDGSDNTDLIVRINPRYAKFMWQGSDCSSAAIALAGTMYTGHTLIYKGNSTASGNLLTSSKNLSSYPNNRSVKVQANSQSLTFHHEIYRNTQGPTNDNEEYYVEAATGNGPARGSSSSRMSYTSTKDKTETVYTKDNPSGNGFSVGLTPGQEKVIRQTLYYQLSNINSGLLNYVDIQCTLTSPSTGGSACVKLWRPVAKFTGSVTAGVSVENNNTFLTPNTNQDAGDEIIESNGNFKVRFGASITRKANSGTDADEAGGTASTKWHIIRTSNGSNLTSSRIPSGTGDNTTSALSNGNTDNVVEVSNNSNDYVYTGRLKYGEVRTICAVLSFDKIVDAKNGNTPDTAEKCVKVWRKPKKCDLNTASETYEFGVYTGRNLGRIGVVNRTYSGNDNYVYTNNSPSSFVRSGSTNNYYTPAVSVWARPGDSVRFVQESCAGGAYAVNNSSLSNTTLKTTYTSTGSLGDGKDSDNSSTGYLFGNSFAGATQSNPLKYPSSVSWDNGGTETDNFPYKENVEFEYSSPSGNNSTPSGYTDGTYSDSPHNQSSYSCVNLEHGASFVSNHYQIAGQATASDAGCHAYSRTAVASDVGHTITQSLSWNDVNIIKSVDQNTSTHKHIAKASVKIPYNYTLQPVISSNTESNVAYLGTSITFDVDIITSPRKNNSFGSNESMNTYATISKPTNVNVKTYFVINGHETTKTSLASNSGIRFNNTGNLEGTKNMNTPYASGGHNYSSNSVYIDESQYYSSGGGYFGGGSKTFLNVGDKVCAEVTVTPADSHNIYSATNPTAAVTGASNGLTGSNKDESIALKETGSSSITRTSCYTIAKKPTMSVEASNTFSGGANGFVTSRYTKRFTAGGTDYLFGSWSEYGVYGNVKTTGSRGIASGATFGYATNNDGITTVNSTRKNEGNVAKNDPTHGKNVCVFSTQTFINSDCESGNVGSNANGEKSATDFRKRIYDRFISATTQESLPKSKTEDPKDGIDHPEGVYNWSKNHSGQLTSPAEYGYIKIHDEDYAFLRNWVNKRFDANGVNHTYRIGNAYLGAVTAPHVLYSVHNAGNQEYVDEATGQKFVDRNYTRLIEVTGDLVLDSDVVVGSNADAEYDSTLTRAGEVVQNIIIAKRVLITSRVSRIDAIIIADEVNTCAFKSINDVKDYSLAAIGNIDADDCNNQLHFRGPVISKKVILNRTYGAGRDTTSAQRAELFDLNPYTYLWSYGQMTRYSQAVTVFSRELPTRY